MKEIDALFLQILDMKSPLGAWARRVVDRLSFPDDDTYHIINGDIWVEKSPFQEIEMPIQDKLPTLGDLLAVLQNLPPKMLAHPIVWLGDERGGKVKRLNIAQDDILNDDGQATPRSDMERYAQEENPGMTVEQAADETATFPVYAVKGQLILEVD